MGGYSTVKKRVLKKKGGWDRSEKCQKKIVSVVQRMIKLDPILLNRSLINREGLERTTLVHNNRTGK